MRRDHAPCCLTKPRVSTLRMSKQPSAPWLSPPCRLRCLSGCQEEKTRWTEARSFISEKGGCRWKNDPLFAPWVLKVYTTALVSLLFWLERPHDFLLLVFCLIPRNIPPGKALPCLSVNMVYKVKPTNGYSECFPSRRQNVAWRTHAWR